MIATTHMKHFSILDFYLLDPAFCDIYFYDEEAQLADKMTGALSDTLQDLLLIEVDPADFEKLYGWFLS